MQYRFKELFQKAQKGHDLYCPKANLVIELDGGQHYDDGRKIKDRQRDGWKQ